MFTHNHSNFQNTTLQTRQTTIVVGNVKQNIMNLYILLIILLLFRGVQNYSTDWFCGVQLIINCTVCIVQLVQPCFYFTITRFKVVLI